MIRMTNLELRMTNQFKLKKLLLIRHFLFEEGCREVSLSEVGWLLGGGLKIGGSEERRIGIELD
jgi:hypothetical protein